MGTKVKTLVGSLAGCVLFVSTAAAQTQTPSGSTTLDQALYRSLAERVQMPLAFATRDTAFALSLPADEPAEVYVQLTVGKNGRVKEKLTRVNANHIAGYVAPAFIEGAKGLSIDRALLAGMTGKDTSISVPITLNYCCVDSTDRMEAQFRYFNRPNLSSDFRNENYHTSYYNNSVNENDFVYLIPTGKGNFYTVTNSDNRVAEFIKDIMTRIRYYIVFIVDQPE